MLVARAGRSFVQCLAVMVNTLQAEDVAHDKDGSESEGLDDDLREWTDMVEKHRPVTEYEIAYLSSM